MNKSTEWVTIEQLIEEFSYDCEFRKAYQEACKELSEMRAMGEGLYDLAPVKWRSDDE